MENLVLRILDRLLTAALRLPARLLPTRKALILLLNLDNRLYTLISNVAIDYDHGLHPKHRLMAYHDYFVRNISGGEIVLDIGCGNGALTFDVAAKTAARTIGIDKDLSNIDYAKRHYRLDNLEFIAGNALAGLPVGDLRVDTVIMSNLIEHIERRVEFIRDVVSKIKPQKILFRVPLYEREWMVPLKRELGVEYRLDMTHYTEYVQEDFFKELSLAGECSLK